MKNLLFKCTKDVREVLLKHLSCLSILELMDHEDSYIQEEEEKFEKLKLSVHEVQVQQ